MLSLFQLLLVCFIAPAFTAGAISLEREKLTLDMLVVTPMRPGGLVIGKLFSALAFVILMLLAGIPISALVLMYGGRIGRRRRAPAGGALRRRPSAVA